MTGNRPILGLGGTGGDRDHVPQDPAAGGPAGASRVVHRTRGAQRLRKSSVDGPPAARITERQVDRLVGDLRAGLLRVMSPAGVGGPAVSLYAANAGWAVRELVPNAQFYGLTVDAFSLTAKRLPQLTTPAWVLAGTAIAAGAVIGKALAERVPEGRDRRIVPLLALAGGLATAGKGLAGL